MIFNLCKDNSVYFFLLNISVLRIFSKRWIWTFVINHFIRVLWMPFRIPIFLLSLMLFNFWTYQFSSTYDSLLIEHYTTFTKPHTLQRRLPNANLVSRQCTVNGRDRSEIIVFMSLNQVNMDYFCHTLLVDNYSKITK